MQLLTTNSEYAVLKAIAVVPLFMRTEVSQWDLASPSNPNSYYAVAGLGIGLR